MLRPALVVDLPRERQRKICKADGVFDPFFLREKAGEIQRRAKGVANLESRAVVQVSVLNLPEDHENPDIEFLMVLGIKRRPGRAEEEPRVALALLNHFRGRSFFPAVFSYGQTPF